jgi:hypothetical protein
MQRRPYTLAAILMMVVLSGMVATTSIAVAGTSPLALSAVLGGHPKTPVVDGDRVYLPSGRVISTWNHVVTGQPELESTTSAPAAGQIQALTRLGDHLYAGWSNAFDNSGLAIYSLADPARPMLVNQIDDYSPASLKILRSVVAANGHLYVFDSENGVFYSDVANPEDPQFTFVFRTPTIYNNVVAADNHLYALAQTLMGNAAMVTFDISDPTNPTPVSGSGQYFTTQLFALDVAPPLVAGFGEQLTLLDVTDPGAVVTRGIVGTPPASQGVVIGDHAWSFGFDGIDIWTISDPDAPAAAGHADIDLLGADVVARIGGDPLVATRTDRIARLDAGDPALPSLVSQAALPGGADARDIAVVGDVALVLQEAYGLSIVDAATLAPIGRFDVDLPAQLNMRSLETFAVDGDRVYLTAWGFGLLIVDISDPTKPVEIGRYPYEFASEVAAEGDIVYVGKSTNGGELRVLDVSDPSAPVLLGTFNANEPRRLQVRGTHVYMADALLGGLRIIDVGNPQAPVQVGFYDLDCEYLGNTAYDVVLDASDDVAYVACPTGMHVVDIGNPAQPVRVGWYAREPDFFSNRPRVEARNDRAWYSDGSGVHEIDIADRTTPVGLAVTPLTYTSPNRLRAADDGRLFVFTGASGLHVFGDAPASDDVIFADGFDDAAGSDPVVSDYDDVAEGFLGASWAYNGVIYSEINNIGGVFPNGDTFLPVDVGDQVIVEDATVFYGEFPDFGSSPNALTFGTSYVNGGNLSLGALVRARMALDEPASAASFDLAYYENGPWIGIVFHLDAYDDDVLVASDTLAITGDDPEGRDRIALSSLSVAAARFDSLRVYATFGDDYSAPRALIDNLALTPAGN